MSVRIRSNSWSRLDNLYYRFFFTFTRRLLAKQASIHLPWFYNQGRSYLSYVLALIPPDVILLFNRNWLQLKHVLYKKHTGKVAIGRAKYLLHIVY